MKKILWTGHDIKPDKDELREWFFNQLERNDRIMFLVNESESNISVGYLYLDVVGTNDIIEIGHGVNSKYKGKGIGTKIIKYALDYTKTQLKFIKEVHGWILEDNIGSIKNVMNNGYEETKETKEVYIKKFNGYKRMKKYVYKINR